MQLLGFFVFLWALHCRTLMWTCWVVHSWEDLAFHLWFSNTFQSPHLLMITISRTWLQLTLHMLFSLQLHFCLKKWWHGKNKVMCCVVEQMIFFSYIKYLRKGEVGFTLMFSMSFLNDLLVLCHTLVLSLNISSVFFLVFLLFLPLPIFPAFSSWNVLTTHPPLFSRCPEAVSETLRHHLPP